MDLTLSEYIDSLAPQLQTWRRDLHKYAESAWKEYRTATIVAEELHQLGFQLQLGKDVMNAESRMGLPDDETLQKEEQRALQQGALPQWLPYFSGGFTAIVATLDSGLPGPVIAFRVDMDALDLDEDQTAEHRPFKEGFSSCNAHMMHACGHDGHTAIGLGLARVISQFSSQLRGKIKLIFQPAEEGTRGAKAIADSGILDDVNYLTALHIGLDVPLGQIICGNGSFMATTKFDVTFEGVAAHSGARPEQGRNALLAAAQATLGLHSISHHSEGSSRVNVGVLKAGSGRNIIPSSAMIMVETRGETNAVNDYVFQRAKEVINGAAIMHGVDYKMELKGAAICSTPSPAWVQFIHQQAEKIKEITHITDYLDRPAGSEDATFMMERVKAHGGLASYVIFGSELAAGHHHPRFDFNEQVMLISVKTLARIAFYAADFTDNFSQEK